MARQLGVTGGINQNKQCVLGTFKNSDESVIAHADSYEPLLLECTILTKKNSSTNGVTRTLKS